MGRPGPNVLAGTHILRTTMDAQKGRRQVAVDGAQDRVELAQRHGRGEPLRDLAGGDDPRRARPPEPLHLDRARDQSAEECRSDDAVQSPDVEHQIMRRLPGDRVTKDVPHLLPEIGVPASGEHDLEGPGP